MTLRYGNSGQHVTELTRLLVDEGLLNEVTDTFSPEVETAVMAFQCYNLAPDGTSLDVDGIYGPQTQRALLSKDDNYIFPETSEFFLMPENDGGSTIGRAALMVGLEELAVGAGEEGGNNRGPFVAKYHRVSEEDLGSGWAWCAAFASYCFHEAAKREGVTMPFKYTGGAKKILSQLKNRGLAYDANVRRPQPGDLAFWWRENPSSWKGHVGIVYDTTPDGTVMILEGNRGRFPSRVRVYSYQLGNIPKFLSFASPV